MALLGREFIAVPDDRKGQIVFKWPDITIRRYTRAIVNADEMAMFVNTGQVVQTLGPGRHQIDANELPGLGAIIDHVSGGNAYRAELYFVGTREYTGFKFGGRVDNVQDPRTGLVVTLRVFGDYALRVADPVRLVTNLTATVDVTDNERIAGWVSDQLLKVLRTHVTTQIIRNGWPILGLMAYSAEIEQNTIDAGNGQLAAYGVQLTRMGNFDINLSPEDEQQLKQLAKDTSYSQLAGGFQNYAAGEMALGAGQGLAKGGAGTEGAFLGAGFGLASAFGAQQAQAMQAQQAEAAQRAAAQYGVPYGQGGAPQPPQAGAPQPPQAGAPQPPQGGAPQPPQGGAPQPPQGGQPDPRQAPPPQPAATAQQAAAGVVCASCQASNPAGAKFCMSCGQGLAPAVTHCTECGTELPGGAHFCANCGTGVRGCALSRPRPRPVPSRRPRVRRRAGPAPVQALAGRLGRPGRPGRRRPAAGGSRWRSPRRSRP
jgi:membrane protease subunit (stomatin/prohibitin family)